MNVFQKTLLTISIAFLCQTANAQMTQELNAKNFETVIDGKPVHLYTLKNKNGMVVKITNYGARIEQILAPNKKNQLGDVVQGYDSIDAVLKGQASMGAFIGRYANRITDGKFSLDGQSYQLAINDISTNPATPRNNTLHGGKKGSRFKVFDAVQLSPSTVAMSIVFADGEEGFPGTLPVRVIYQLNDKNELSIKYSATALDKDTVGNFTGHAFFNLSGDLGSSIENHLLKINSDKTLEVSPALAPNGKIRSITNTPLDFSQFKSIGKDIHQDYDLLKAGNGYDNHFIVKNYQNGQLQLDSKIIEPKSGRTLEIWSTEPGIQLYSGNFLEGKIPRDQGKNGVIYKFRSAFALEPSHYPDSVNHSNFPSTEIKKGQTYTGEIVYKFGITTM